MRIVPVGNIQYDQFRALTPPQMAQTVRGGPEECRGKRLILSPTAGPYEEAISGRVAANYPAFVQAAWEFR